MPERERIETESMPLTEPYKPTFDTGMQPRAEPEVIEPDPAPRRRRFWNRRPATPADDEPVSGIIPTAYADAEPLPSEEFAAIPSAMQYVDLTWWKFLLTLLAVWVPAAAIGVGLFYWWSHDLSTHKTAVVYVVLAYVVVCTVAALILAMTARRPIVSALAIAMLSAVFASVIGAAPAYGKFYCAHSHRHCVAGLLPY